MRQSLALCLSLFACAAFAQSPTADGTMFRDDARHSGIYAGKGVPALKGVKWKFQTNGKMFSSVAVANGVAYAGSTDHFMYALDLATGALKWKFDTHARITSTAAVVDGLVLFPSYDGYFYALNVADGTVKWKFATRGERRFTAKGIHGLYPHQELLPDMFDFFESSPVVENGIVYFGSGDSYVYALDLKSGELKWKFETGNAVHTSPAVSDGLVYVGGFDGNLYGLDAASGELKHRFSTGIDPQFHNQEGIQSSPVVADGVVYFGCRDSKVYALDAKTFAKKWDYSNKGSWVIASPIVKNGVIYFGTSDSGMFRALDAATGKELFSESFKWLMFSSPSIAGDTLYVGTHEGKLFAFDLAAKKVAWIFQTEDSKKNAPSFSNAEGKPDYSKAMTDSFYETTVIGVDKMFSVGSILASPVIAGDVVLVTSTDGNVYAIQ